MGFGVDGVVGEDELEDPKNLLRAVEKIRVGRRLFEEYCPSDQYTVFRDRKLSYIFIPIHDTLFHPGQQSGGDEFSHELGGGLYIWVTHSKLRT